MTQRIENVNNETTTEAARPSRLKSQDSLLLQTYSAQQLYTGTKQGPLGVEKFSSLMLSVWRAAAFNDPYADHCLLEVYNLMISVTRQLHKAEAEYRKKLEARDGIEMGLAVADNPLKIPLNFKTPYGHMAAYLLVDYDRLCRVIVSAKYAALLTPDESDAILRTMRRKVRHVFSRPLKWRYTGVTRDDIAANNQKAEQAVTLMGKLNQPLLEGKLRSPFAPRLVKPELNHE